MRTRVLLIVAVVGALLVGGATTGTTLASWRDQAAAGSGTVTSGTFLLDINGGGTTSAISLGTLPALALNSGPTAGAAQAQSATLNYSVTGKNNQMQLALTGITANQADLVSGLEVAAVHGDAARHLPRSGRHLPGAEQLHLDLARHAEQLLRHPHAVPLGPGQGRCAARRGRQVRGADPHADRDAGAAVTGRRTTLVVVGLVLAFLAPMSTAYALWSRTATASVNVSVAASTPTTPTAPVLSCVSASGTSISWTATGTTYHVFESADGTTWPPAALVQGTSATTYNRSPFPAGNSATRYYRVVAINGGGSSTPSNVVKINRNGNSSNYTCVVVP